ncbi:RNA-binding protein 34 [Dichanthelium oligosanthes]|uniref:RNA-binding protein 34 n=1 Tax=Dichanthelium oligosanthes TaxID=888268 RepID=A0A1E5W4K3_9POAL|nr:RNA-binding protein 34 [Dichanthelium oligosanthes]
MAKKHKDPAPEAAGEASPAAAIRSLFSADNPFRRKPSTEEPPAAAPPATPLRKHPNPDAQAAEPSSKKRKSKDEGPQRKRKRDEVEAGRGRRRGAEKPPGVGEKRKAPDDAAAGAEEEDDEEAFDDETKLLRTVFVGNLPLRTKRKVLTKEFAPFGEIESVRIRSVPLVDSKLTRKGAVLQGKVNELVDNVHAYIVFQDEQSARAALSHNMALFGGNHIRVDMACPPRKKLRGEGPLYDRKRTVFVGNLPFDVKDEELYKLFCGSSGSEGDVEAIRVVRDPNSSLGKGIAYVLFKTREAANAIVRKKDMKIRDRSLRLTHARPVDTTPKKTTEAQKKKRVPKDKEVSTPGSKSNEGSDRAKRKASALSYQGLRSSKSGVVKKVKVNQRPSSNPGKQSKTNETGASARKGKRPAVAAKKAKQLAKKRKLDASTPENTHRSKKPRK